MYMPKKDFCDKCKKFGTYTVVKGYNLCNSCKDNPPPFRKIEYTKPKPKIEPKSNITQSKIKKYVANRPKKITFEMKLYEFFKSNPEKYYDISELQKNFVDIKLKSIVSTLRRLTIKNKIYCRTIHIKGKPKGYWCLTLEPLETLKQCDTTERIISYLEKNYPVAHKRLAIDCNVSKYNLSRIGANNNQIARYRKGCYVYYCLDNPEHEKKIYEMYPKAIKL